MSVITVKNVPKAAYIGTEINYNDFYILPKKRFSISSLVNYFYDEKTNSYGPFRGEEAISFLDLVDLEEKWK